jgi:hypothetical protein
LNKVLDFGGQLADKMRFILLVEFYFQFPGRQEVSVKSKKALLEKFGTSGIQIQGQYMMAVLHHGEPCTLRWSKNIIFGNKKKMLSFTRFWTL